MMDFEVSDNLKFSSVKRLFDNNNSLDISNKKSKVSPFDDQGKDEDDIPLSNISKRPDKSADNLFSSMRKELASVKLSFEKCNRNPQVEERRLRSIKRDIEKCCKELENKETQVKEFESKKGEFEDRVKDFESEKTIFESRQKEFESKEKEFEEKVKEFQSKEEKFKGQLKVFEAKEEEFKSKEQQFENQVEDILKFGKDNLKGIQLKENKLNNSGGQLKELELIEKQYDEEKEFDTSYMDDELSNTFDGTSAESVILDNLRESSDPAKIILDIIVDPIVPLPKKGDKVVLIDESRIYLLEQLMKISPNIKSCVRDEALKLAHVLKANMKENTENSLEVLGFLLILSIYGLRAYFNEDEVLKLFGSVTEYKIAVELLETLGLSN